MGEHSKPLHRWLSFYLRAPKWRTLTALSAVVLALLVYFGFMTYTNIKYARLEAEVNTYESLWNNSQISGYRYIIYAAGNEGPSTVRVTVMDGNVVSEENVGYRLVPSYFAGSDTVPLFFNAIHKAVRERTGGWKADLGIAFSPDFGYPIYIRLYEDRGVGNSADPPAYSLRDFFVLKQSATTE
jgi:hypothetical protein